MDDSRIIIFDTTLRDGEQSPGISLNTAEKLEIAHQLARLGVDVIEAGFPISSPGDFEAVRAIAREVHGPVIAGLARAHAADIERAAEAVRDAGDLGSTPSSPRRTSTSSTSCSRRARTCWARRAPPWRTPSRSSTTWSSRRWTPPAPTSSSPPRSSPPRSRRGRPRSTSPTRSATRCRTSTPPSSTRLFELVPPLRDVVLSVHCHDDLGLAVANSFAGLKAGARQIECAINGIGERPATPRSRSW